jgi:hypothetical protein
MMNRRNDDFKERFSDVGMPHVGKNMNGKSTFYFSSPSA